MNNDRIVSYSSIIRRNALRLLAPYVLRGFNLTAAPVRYPGAAIGNRVNRGNHDGSIESDPIDFSLIFHFLFRRLQHGDGPTVRIERHEIRPLPAIL